MLLDIGLPGLNGYELAQMLRADPLTNGAILIALTGYGQPSDRERALASGFSQHLVKPVQPEALRAALAALRHPRGRLAELTARRARSCAVLHTAGARAAKRVT